MTQAAGGYCPMCRQRVAAERLGVRLSPLKAAIVDMVRASGNVGITSVEIIAELYVDRRPVLATAIKAHIWQINDLLECTDWQIYSDRRRWFLGRRC
jgi:hypothetical protein